MSESRFRTLGGHLATAGAYTIFGLNIVFCKDIANSGLVSPVVLFTFRVGGAALLFWLLSLFLPPEPVRKGDFGPIALASFIGLFVPQLTFLMAMPLASPIDTAVMSTLGPIFTMFFALFFLGEPVTGQKAGGVALSFAGVLFLIFNSVHTGGVGHSTPGGIFFLLLNCLSFSLYLGAFRPLIGRYGVVTFMKWMFLFSFLLSLPVSARALLQTPFSALSPQLCWEIGYMVVFATFISYFLIPVGQKILRPTLVSMYSYVQPVIAAVVGIRAGMDSLSWQKAVATVLIVTGVLLVSRSRGRKEKS